MTAINFYGILIITSFSLWEPFHNKKKAPERVEDAPEREPKEDRGSFCAQHKYNTDRRGLSILPSLLSSFSNQQKTGDFFMFVTINTDDFKRFSMPAAATLALIRYRLKLSERNNWKDKDGTYCIYTAAELAETLDITERHVRRVLKELEDNGYIRKKSVSGNRVYIYLNADPDKLSPTYRDNNKYNNIESSSSVPPAPEEPQTEEEDDDLYKVIEKTAVRMNLTLSKAEIITILSVIRSKSDQIGHLTAYIRTCIRNQVIKRSAPPSAAKSYAPTYNIEEYESISAIDEED